MSAERTARDWRKTIRIKQFLSEDGSDGNVRKVAGEIAAVLKAQREYTPFDSEARDFNDEFSDIVDELAGIAADDCSAYDSGWTRCSHFNSVLVGLYDWADANRVWIGGDDV